jgi:LysM repeat protein/GH25 family lysozyme M1 (1,4-beta-N-acetylmuramidase)
MEKLNKYYKKISALALSVGLAFSVAPNVMAQQPNVDFIDVSHYNGEQGLPLSFYQTAKAGGVKGTVVKVSEGTYYVDPAASVNIANARQAGMVVSAYHFARYKSVDGAKNEADWFDKKLQLVGFSKTGDGYVVVDIEDNSLTTDKIALTAYTNAFINEMKSLGYSKVDVYSGSYYYNNRLQPSNLPDKPWLASYPSNPQAGQPTANFSNGTGAWQWTSSWTGMAGYGRFDASEDYAGKYTNAVKDSTPNVGTIGNISLVDYMKSKGMDASFVGRTTLATQYGITDYTGSAAQNLALLSKLQNGIQPAKINIDNSKLNTDQPAPRPITSPAVSVNVKQSTSVSKPSTYIVRSGDSLSKIASKYGMTVSNLTAINGIKNKNFIRVGQVLKLTGTVTQPAASKVAYYTVKKGDTVWYLSRKFGTSMAQIKSWNKLNMNYVIHPGQKLRVK